MTLTSNWALLGAATFLSFVEVFFFTVRRGNITGTMILSHNKQGQNGESKLSRNIESRCEVVVVLLPAVARDYHRHCEKTHVGLLLFTSVLPHVRPETFSSPSSVLG